MLPLAVVTGFGAFEKVQENPSGALVRALLEDPPAGWRVEGAELPVSFERAPLALDELVAGLSEGPALFLPMGVHKKPGYRLERLARAAPKGKPGRVDNDGVALADAAPSASPEGAAYADHASLLPLEDFARHLQEAHGLEAFVSEDAGGYVCERVYHHVLQHARERVPAFFLHVPPLRYSPLEEQLIAVRAVFARIRALG